MYFRKFWVPTSAAKMEPMLSAAMPDADVPRMTLSRSDGSGMNALSEPVMAFPVMMPRSSPFLADGSGNEDVTVGCHRNAGWPIEPIRTGSGHALLAKHHQHLAVGA